MSYFTPSSSLDSVPMILEDTQLLGGDAAAPLNAPLQALLNRIEHHKQNKEADPHGLGAAIAAAISALTKASVGLSNVDNTADASKPVSTAQAAAISAAISALTKASVGLSNADNTSDATVIAATIAALTKASVGLSNVDNTADASKPVSTAQAAAISAAISALTKASVGLSNADNTSDATVIAATIAALLAQNNVWTKAQRGAFAALTSASASIAVDLDRANNFNHTLTENTTLAAPTHAVAGQSGVIEFTQHASSPKTLALNAFWKFPGGAPSPVLTATNGAIDVLTYVVASTGTYAICSMGKAVS